jgi:transposase-like protein
MSKGREFDARSPLFVWAPAHGSGASECGHGVVIETHVEHGSFARGVVTLELCEIERDTGVWVNAFGDPVSVTCSLDSGECTPHDHDGVRFLFERPWLKNALVGELHHLRRRAARAAAQADRETSPARALANANPNAMIAYDELFPADWDLVVHREGVPYWAVDLYCHNPQCTCTDVTVSFYELESGQRGSVGRLRLDVPKDDGELRIVEKSTGDELTALFLEKYGEHLRARHADARRAILRFAPRRRPASAGPRPQAGRVPRNASCPCGSGKKYKRCCIVSAARAPSFREDDRTAMLAGMKTRRSAAQWAELVAAWDSSGLSAEAFASERGLVETTLRWWKAELESRARGETRRRPPRREDRPMEAVRLARVVRPANSSASSGGIVVQVGAARVVVESGFDPRLLRELVAALEGV